MVCWYRLHCALCIVRIWTMCPMTCAKTSDKLLPSLSLEGLLEQIFDGKWLQIVLVIFFVELRGMHIYAESWSCNGVSQHGQFGMSYYLCVCVFAVDWMWRGGFGPNLAGSTPHFAPSPLSTNRPNAKSAVHVWQLWGALLFQFSLLSALCNCSFWTELQHDNEIK